jgi:hypothetical protein
MLFRRDYQKLRDTRQDQITSEKGVGVAETRRHCGPSPRPSQHLTINFDDTRKIFDTFFRTDVLNGNCNKWAIPAVSECLQLRGFSSQINIGTCTFYVLTPHLTGCGKSH